MELVVLLFVVTLLPSCEPQGSSVVTPVFVKKGEDVLLNVTKADDPEDVVFASWSFNEAGILSFTPNSPPKVSPDYTGRVEFNETNCSMKLKNLQQADSGLYTALVFRGANQKKTHYNVTVQDPVSPVKLSVDSVSNSSDSCHHTVSCRTQDSHINSSIRCVNQTCSQDGGQQSKVTTSGATLQVYLDNDSIICNHSNQVSWTEDMRMIQHFCPQPAEPPEPHNSIPYAGVIGVIVLFPIIIIIIIIISVAAWCWRKRTNSKSQDIESTVYEVPQLGMTHRLQNPAPTDNASGPSPDSTYCLVGQHAGPAENTEPRGLNQPESLYAQVDKPRTVKT